MFRPVALVPLFFLGCAHTSPPAASAPASAPATAPAKAAPVVAPPAPLAADTPTTTANGNTFTAPAAWSLARDGAKVVLTAPEGDSHVAIVDVTAKDADTAVAAAWQAYRPEAKRTVKLSTPRPGRNGWDEARAFDYETSPNERAVVGASALRHGDAWTVVIIDGTEATVERRGAQLGLALQSLRPKGYERESFAGRKAHPLDAERVKMMTDFIEGARRELGVPGVGLGLIDGGKVVYAGGLGVRELGKPQKVDADTLFMIASNTKQLSTLLLAKLVDAGKLRWDQHVTELMPSFKLGDADTTRQVEVKHLVCACTGLPRQDMEFIFEFRNSTPASSMALLGTMQPTSKFGEVFQYSNLLAAAGGFVGGHVLYPDRELGAAYDEAMRKLVFEPLGMRSTTFDFARAVRSPDRAAPHGDDIDGHTRVEALDLDRAIIPARPAGAAWSNVTDLVRYVQMELARGKLRDGKVYISEENLVAREKPQISLGEDVSYGMGLIVDKHQGVPVVFHGGDLLGYHSDVVWLPEHGVGAVLLINSDAGAIMRGPFRRRLLEVLFDGKPEAVESVAANARQYKAAMAKERERLIVPADPEQVSKLAARYENPALGAITVKHKGKATIFDFDEWSSEVATRKNDDGSLSFVAVAPGVQDLQFVADTRDGKRALVLRDAQHEYVFSER